MAARTTHRLLTEALSRHEAGDAAGAGRLYEKVLRADPANADALHLRGVLAHQLGQHQEALDWISRAIRINPRVPDFHSNCGTIFSVLGRWTEAVEAYEQVVRLQPGFQDADYNLGVALQQCGRLEDAIACYERCLRRGPEPGAYNNLGVAYREMGRLKDAVRCFHQVLEVQPAYPEACLNLAATLRTMGDLVGAVRWLKQSVDLQPDNTVSRLDLAKTLHQLGRDQEAVEQYQIVLRREADPEALNNLGVILESEGQTEEAEQLYRRSLQQRPDHPEGLENLGNMLQTRLQFKDALACYDQALRIRPQSASIHYNRSLALLACGDWEEGWQEYEWRWEWTGFSSPKAKFTQPAWEGDALEGRTILLYAEQGLGDTLQFVRYASLVAERAGRVFLLCPQELHPLCADLPGVDRLIAPSETLPQFDTHAPLMSLPRLFGTRVESVPARIPYLKGASAEVFPLDPAPAGHWKVGLVWAGGDKYKRNRWRSAPLPSLLPLLRMAGVEFYSLQVGPAAEALKDLPADVRVHALGQRIRSWVDTAAVLGQLDLLVSTCTSVPHLAGALGRPVWLMLSQAPCWRWLQERTDTPWYPTMRLFRQESSGDWDGVVARVKRSLQEWMDEVALS